MTSPAQPSGAPAGWYADPHGLPALRWWDGGEWTSHIQPGGAATPPPMPPAIPLTPPATTPLAGMPPGGPTGIPSNPPVGMPPGVPRGMPPGGMAPGAPTGAPVPGAHTTGISDPGATELFPASSGDLRAPSITAPSGPAQQSFGPPGGYPMQPVDAVPTQPVDAVPTRPFDAVPTQPVESVPAQFGYSSSATRQSPPGPAAVPFRIGSPGYPASTGSVAPTGTAGSDSSPGRPAAGRRKTDIPGAGPDVRSPRNRAVVVGAVSLLINPLLLCSAYAILLGIRGLGESRRTGTLAVTLGAAGIVTHIVYIWLLARLL
jgi:hypothetical protein